jgi:WD40 repeat protein
MRVPIISAVLSLALVSCGPSTSGPTGTPGIDASRFAKALPGPGRIWGVEFSPDGKILAAGSDNGSIKLWDGETFAEKGTLKGGHTTNVLTLSFSADGARLASLDVGMAVRLWDVAKQAELNRLPLDKATAIALSPDGKTLAFGTIWKVELWDVDGGNVIDSIDVPNDTVFPILFSNDGKSLVFATSSGKAIWVWDLAGKKTATVLKGHPAGVLAMALSRDGKKLVSSDSKANIFLWNMAGGEPLPLKGATIYPQRLCFLDGGKAIASATVEVNLWDAATCKHLTTMPLGEVTAGCAFSPEARYLAVGSGSLVLIKYIPDK